MPATPEFFTLQEAVAGRYSLVRELGRGGMGIVFLARDVALDRPVAIKMLPPDLAASRPHCERFVREARTAARLAHPHIVPVHSVEEHPGVVFFVMGFVDGETLGARVAREGVLTGAEATRIMQEVAWALAHAHAHGVVHRDVKPDNILLERASGRVLVTDFGIARRDDVGDSSGEGRVIGTPRYMSPEQASGDPVDGRSDLYSLGAVAFFAVTGRAPFEGASAVSVMAKHVTAQPPSVGAMRPGLPVPLVGAIGRCLAKSPTARFSTAEELAITLRGSGSSEIAPSVRAFTRETEGASTQIVSFATASAVSLTGFAQAYFFAPGSVFDFIEVALFLGIAAAMAGLIGVRVFQIAAAARDAIRDGYGHSAISSGLLMEAQNREPEHRGGSHWPGTIACTAATAGSIWLAGTETFVPALIGIAGAIAVPSVYVSRLLCHPPPEGSWLSRLLRGRLGRLVFRVAGIGLKDRPQPKPVAGEPTAVALSHAVCDLFNALPESQRRELAELPALIARLEADALAMREHTPDPSSNDRFITTVALLETLRLDLLRLHASAASVADLTRHLDAATRIGDEVSLQMRAQLDVNRTPA